MVSRCYYDAREEMVPVYKKKILTAFSVQNITTIRPQNKMSINNRGTKFVSPSLPYMRRKHLAHDFPVVAGATGVPLGELLRIGLPEDANSFVVGAGRWQQEHLVRHLVLRNEVLPPRETPEVVGFAGLAERDSRIPTRHGCLDAEHDNVIEVAPALRHFLRRGRRRLPERPA